MFDPFFNIIAYPNYLYVIKKIKNFNIILDRGHAK